MPGSAKKKYKRSTDFKKDWELKFGVQVSTVDPTTKLATSVVCLFCKVLGRNQTNMTASGEKRQRKRTERVQYYTAPFRADNMRSHNEAQHSNNWSLYKELGVAEKMAYFNQREPDAVLNMRSFFVQPQASATSLILAKQKCCFNIDAPILDDILGGLLFDFG